MGTTRVDGSGVDTSPVGTMKFHGGANLPTGYLWCDGYSYLTAEYPDLFSAIGYTFGGAGPNFNVPDLRAKSPIGLNNNSLPNGQNGSFSQRNAAATGGAETHALSVGELASHGHGHTLAASAANAPHSHGGAAVAGGAHVHSLTGSINTESAHNHGNTSIQGANHIHQVTRASTSNTSHTHTTGHVAAGPSNDTVVADTSNNTTDHLHGTGAGSAHTHTHTLSAASGGSHGHTINSDNANHGHSVSGSISNNGSGTAHENMQPFVTVGFIIRY